MLEFCFIRRRDAFSRTPEPYADSLIWARRPLGTLPGYSRGTLLARWLFQPFDMLRRLGPDRSTWLLLTVLHKPYSWFDVDLGHQATVLRSAGIPGSLSLFLHSLLVLG